MSIPVGGTSSRHRDSERSAANPDLFPVPNARRGGRGTGQIEATAFAIAPASVGFWLGRLNENHVPAERAPLRFEQEVIRFADPDGMILELIASAPGREVEAWTASSVPAGTFSARLHSVSAALEGYESSAKLLTEVFGYELVQEKGNRFRFAPPDMTGPARMIDLLCMPDTQHARGGAGTVHHIAFRTPDDASQRACREQLVKLGFNVSPVMDRRYFHSIYFREPGGILFEIATDPPGLQRTRQSRNSVTSCAFRHGWKTPARRSKKSFQPSPERANNPELYPPIHAGHFEPHAASCCTAPAAMRTISSPSAIQKLRFSAREEGIC